MIGEIRLSYFLDGVGFYKDCSDLLYAIDSGTDTRYFKEGQILEIDQAFFKVQSVELIFIDLPWKGKGEKPNRSKPIKIIYVAKTSVSLLGEKSKKKIIAVNKVPSLKELPEFDTSQFVVDEEYSNDKFLEDFPHLVKPVKKTRQKKEKKRLEKNDIKKLKSLKQKKVKKVPEKKVEKPVINNRRRAASSMLDLFDGNSAKKPIKAKRKKRCERCNGLFKDINKHKCKGD